MFKTRLSDMNENLTFLERKIAHYLIQYYGEFPNGKLLTSTEIAQANNCGQATVVRFSQKLGYPTFKSMIQDLANESVLNCDNKILANETVRDTMNKMQYQYTETVNDVMVNISDQLIENVVGILKNSSVVLFCGYQSSSAIASIMYYRLQETGGKVMFANNPRDAITLINCLDSSAAVFFVSASGETPEIIHPAQVAFEKKMQIIAMTENENSTLAKLSNAVLKCSNNNVHTNRFNLINRAAQMFLVDVIFIRLWRENEETLISSTENYIHQVGKGSIEESVKKDGNFRL